MRSNHRLAAVWSLATVLCFHAISLFGAAEPAAVEAGNVAENGSPRESDSTEAPSETADQSKPVLKNKIEPTAFNGAQLGTTSRTELTKGWGKPLESTDIEGGEILSFKMKPFKRIDVELHGDTVASIVIYLEQPLRPHQVAKQLGLESMEYVPVPDQQGSILGRAYPERGVTFSFAADSKPSQVTEILLEPVSAEPFVLRALYDSHHRYEQNLADLDQAIHLDVQNAQAHWLKAERLGEMGRYEEGLQNVRAAVHLDPNTAQYRLTMARLLAETGDHQQAVKQVKMVLASQDIAPQTQALGELISGDLLATGPKPDYASAMEHHQKAIELAAPMAVNQQFAIRRLAKRVLVDAHLAVALDIAAGDWQRKRKVVPKWLDRADSLVKEIVQNDHGDRTLQLLVLRKRLETYMHLDKVLDPTSTADSAIKLGRRLIAESDDTLYKHRIQWELGTALVDALGIEQARGKHDQAMRYANNAAALLEAAAEHRPASPRQNSTLARFYFLAGSIQAIGHSDHHQAVIWYDKATGLMIQPGFTVAKSQQGRRGEWLVSMGLSYWEVNDRSKAVRITRQGTKWVQQAVQDGVLDESALAVPYGNLANMYRKLGNAKKAKTFAQLAAKLEPPANRTKKR